MFNMGIQELAVIFILALVFIGPKQLPELAKTLGKVFRDFKRASNEITDSLQREAKQFSDIKDDIQKDFDSPDYKLLAEDSAVSKDPEKTTAEKRKNDDEI
jgi:Tat protein translocase TatB subunit